MPKFAFPIGLVMALAILPLAANAYIGPGMGGGLVASTIGIVLALLLIVIGLVWYPIKKVIKTFRRKRHN